MKTQRIYIETYNVPMIVEQAAKLLLRHFSVIRGYEYWEFLGICSRDSLTRQEVKNASLRGQLKGLHRARRTRERELEERVASLEKKIGQLPKFTP